MQLKRDWKIQRLIPILVGFSVTALMLWFQLTNQAFLSELRERMEWMAYDLRLNLTLPKNVEPHPIIAILDIDETSLAEVGRWPWPRSTMSKLVGKLRDAGAALIIFDVVFSEPEENIVFRVERAFREDALDSTAILEQFARIAPQFDGDAQLADSLNADDVILGFLFQDSGNYRVGVLPTPLPYVGDLDLASSYLTDMPGYTANIAALVEASGRAASFNASIDADGIVRRSRLVFLHEGKFYPSLSLEAARAFLDVGEIQFNTEWLGQRQAVESIGIDVYDIPTDSEGAVMVPFRGESPAFRYVSAVNVLHDRIPKGSLSGKIVFIGTSARAIADLRPTPVDNLFPGVEIHASILAGILEQKIWSVPGWAVGVNLSIIFISGCLLALLLPMLSAPWMLVLAIPSMLAMVVFNLWIWTSHQLVLALAVPLLLIILLTAINVIYGFLFETRGRSQLKGLFGQYVPPQLVEEMSHNPRNFSLAGEKREMSVLFSDIRSFTSISESLSASELMALLNNFFTPMTEIIFTNRGTIDKYVGDMVMAFWGAPVKDDRHAFHAVKAGLEMLARVETLKVDFKARGWPEINIGVGINSGVMSVGNMGSQFRRAYTVIGDAVNLASRLESLTKKYDVNFIVGEQTQADSHDIVFRRLDRVRVVGKQEPVMIYQPVCLRDQATPELLAELDMHEQALHHYSARQWSEARALFKILDKHSTNRLYRIYRERLEVLETMDAQDTWDGVFEHSSK